MKILKLIWPLIRSISVRMLIDIVKIFIEEITNASGINKVLWLIYTLFMILTYVVVWPVALIVNVIDEIAYARKHDITDEFIMESNLSLEETYEEQIEDLRILCRSIRD